MLDYILPIYTLTQKQLMRIFLYPYDKAKIQLCNNYLVNTICNL